MFITLNQINIHNLKDVNVNIPKNKITSITGPSGSGKSSLAFNVIYAKSYIDYSKSLSLYAKQSLNNFEEPRIGQVSGLSPAIYIGQQKTKNYRETIGSITKIYHYMRLLWSYIGVPISPVTGRPIQEKSTMDLVSQLLALPTGTKLYICAKIQSSKDIKIDIDKIRKLGFQRIYINNNLYNIDDNNINYNNDYFDIVIDRLIINPESSDRLHDSINQAFKISDIIHAYNIDNNDKIILTNKVICSASDLQIDKIEPDLFSCNKPIGWCENCKGLGYDYYFDEELIVEDANLSIIDGALVPFAHNNQSIDFFLPAIKKIASLYKQDINIPWHKLNKQFCYDIINGTKDFIGVIPYLQKNENYNQYLSQQICQSCHGKRLNVKALAIKINNMSIVDVLTMPLNEAEHFFSTITNNLDQSNYKKFKMVDKIIKEIINKLTLLNNIGLNYLQLFCQLNQLSGGELQKVNLISQISSGLTNITYILDEPSTGMHIKDHDKLVDLMRQLVALDNTVIIIEHDIDIVRKTDYIIDMGPGAGVYGGNIVAYGTVQDVINSNSLTGSYLGGTNSISLPKITKIANQFINFDNIKINNLQGVNTKIPIGLLTCISGISGSGKSSLAYAIFQDLKQKLARNNSLNYCQNISGYENVKKIVYIDQLLMNKSNKSNPAIYMGIFKLIREFFAELPQAKNKGYNSNHFNFNKPEGQCNYCKGKGRIKVDMLFFINHQIDCNKCNGQKYSTEILDVKYQNKSIFQILDITFEEAYKFFNFVPIIRKKIAIIKDLGLGYLKLGQELNTLSCGEAQRIKLASLLLKNSNQHTLYIIDEPTKGLHLDDINKLIQLINIIKKDNTVIMIEHSMHVLKIADWIIDMGPNGGIHGGKILATGNPQQIAKQSSHTSNYLKKYL